MFFSQCHILTLNMRGAADSIWVSFSLSLSTSLSLSLSLSHTHTLWYTIRHFGSLYWCKRKRKKEKKSQNWSLLLLLETEILCVNVLSARLTTFYAMSHVCILVGKSAMKHFQLYDMTYFVAFSYGPITFWNRNVHTFQFTNITTITFKTLFWDGTLRKNKIFFFLLTELDCRVGWVGAPQS